MPERSRRRFFRFDSGPDSLTQVRVALSLLSGYGGTGVLIVIRPRNLVMTLSALNFVGVKETLISTAGTDIIFQHTSERPRRLVIERRFLRWRH